MKAETNMVAKSRSVPKEPIKKPTKKVVSKKTVTPQKKRSTSVKALTKISVARRRKSIKQVAPIHKKFAGTSVVLVILAFSFIGISSAIRSSVSDAATTAQPITGIAGKCLDNYANKVVDKNPIILYRCNQSEAQKWTLNDDGSIRNRDFCLDVKGASKIERTYVQLYRCNGTVAQKWVVHSNQTIVNPNSGLCLDDQYARTNDKNPIWVYRCHGSIAQKWVVASAPRPTPVPAPTPTPPSYTQASVPAVLASKNLKLVGGDEFDGTTLDTKKWKAYHNTYGDGNKELACLTPNNVSVSGGLLKIVSKREKLTCPSGSVRNFSSGFVGSREVGVYYPTFAYYEMKGKLPHGQGLWPAFWLRHFNGSSTAEVDIMEYFHSTSPGSTKATLHLDGVTNVFQRRATFESPTLNPSWHTWGVYIEKVSTGVKFTFFLDRVEQSTYTDTLAKWSTNYSQTKLFDIAINGAIGGRYIGNPDSPLGYLDILGRCAQNNRATTTPSKCPKTGILRATFPSTYQVDYVRVFAQQ